MKNRNELIDKNLTLICETEKGQMFASFFLDSEGERIYGKYQSEMFADEMVLRGLIRRIDELCIVTDFGFEVYESGGWLYYKTL